MNDIISFTPDVPYSFIELAKHCEWSYFYEAAKSEYYQQMLLGCISIF